MRTALISDRTSKLLTRAPRTGTATTTPEFRCLRPATIASTALMERAGEVPPPKLLIYLLSFLIVEAFDCKRQSNTWGLTAS